MKPYYQDEFATLYHGDCREVIASQDFQERLDGAVAIVTDPPYGTQQFNDGYGRAGVKIANDSDLVAFDGALAAFEAVPMMYESPVWIAAFCACRRRREAEDVLISRGFSLVGEAVWDKGRPSLGYTIRYAHETVIVGRKGDAKPAAPLISTLRGKRTSEVMAERHPHEKPVEVMARIIEFVSEPGAQIIDPFTGSGSTLRAAKDVLRRAIGIELDEAHCETAAKRLSQNVLNFGGAA